jgi:hypothetical protein
MLANSSFPFFKTRILVTPPLRSSNLKLEGIFLDDLLDEDDVVDLRLVDLFQMCQQVALLVVLVAAVRAVEGEALGVDVINIIFGEFRRLPVKKKMAFFVKTKIKIQFVHKDAVFM